jgi:DNA helicase-2/ATP-dependent DNA helicase PcrA
MEIYDKDPIIDLKNAIVQKMKTNHGLEYSEDDTFDTIVDLFQLRNRQRQLKKDLILSNGENSLLYGELKNLPFSEVRKIYLDKDALIDDKKQDSEDENKKGSKRDALIKHLFKIQTNISLYQEQKYNEFLRKTEYKITQASQKNKIKEYIETLNNMGEQTIEEVIEYADEKGIVKKDDKLESFIEKNRYLYNRVKNLPFKEFQNLFKYLEGYTPFSTQHKIKGAEFNNVLVVLDNGKWNKYNFEYLFTGNGPESVRHRTQKIFYVCCTRAKENLAVFYNNPPSRVIEKTKEWFGDENVQCL